MTIENEIISLLGSRHFKYQALEEKEAQVSAHLEREPNLKNNYSTHNEAQKDKQKLKIWNEKKKRLEGEITEIKSEIQELDMHLVELVPDINKAISYTLHIQDDVFDVDVVNNGSSINVIRKS